MPIPDEHHTGARIREQRRLARLTQRQLAEAIPYSYSLLNQVECGARPATVDFVAAVARALKVDVTVLTGQPYVTELQRDRLAGLVRPIREALDLYDLGADPDLAVRPADQLIAARAADKTAVEAHIAEARTIAKRIGDASDVHWLSLGPANVALHKMSAAVEMRRYDDALKHARKMKLPPQLATSRHAHFLIDQGRTEMETGHTEAALKSLAQARRLAPEQTRYHPAARETITGLVHLSRRTPDTLNHMASWIGR